MPKEYPSIDVPKSQIITYAFARFLDEGFFIDDFDCWVSIQASMYFKSMLLHFN